MPRAVNVISEVAFLRATAKEMEGAAFRLAEKLEAESAAKLIMLSCEVNDIASVLNGDTVIRRHRPSQYQS